MGTGKKALLVVSFGTSFAETRIKTIDQIEKNLAMAFPGYPMYRAWTSTMIIAKLLRRDGTKVPTVKEALEQMLAEGIREVLIQPTHLVNGIENEQMKRDVEDYGTAFDSISFGAPLLTSTEDQKLAIQAVMEEFADLKDSQALVLMGHGTTHYANSIYAAMDYMLKDMGYRNVFLGTVEAYPSLDNLIQKMGEFRPDKIYLAPFMVVAGDHAIHDMSGEGEDSWRSRLEAAGFHVECIMKGLGEYPGIRKLYIQHAKTADAKL